MAQQVGICNWTPLITTLASCKKPNVQMCLHACLEALEPDRPVYKSSDCEHLDLVDFLCAAVLRPSKIEWLYQPSPEPVLLGLPLLHISSAHVYAECTGVHPLPLLCAT